MHDHIFVAKLSFWACGGDDEWPVFQIIKFIDSFFISDFKIRKRCLMFRAPAYNSFTSIYHAIVVELLEGLVDGPNNVGIEREFFTRPIARCSHVADLGLDVAGIRNRKIKNLLIKFMWSHFKARATFFLELFFVYHLRLKTRVVKSRYPQHPEPTHTLIPDHDILNSHHQAVPGMEIAVSISWRHKNGIGLAVLAGQIIRIKKFALFP